MIMETERFIQLIKKLNENQKAGLLMTLEGLRIMADKQKSGMNNR